MKTKLLFAALLTLPACAGEPGPTRQVASALAAVRGAEEAGARNVPQAELHLTLAEEQVERARELMEKDRNDRAHAMAVRAYQDAELALALAREQQARREFELFAENHPAAARQNEGDGSPGAAGGKSAPSKPQSEGEP